MSLKDSFIMLLKDYEKVHTIACWIRNMAILSIIAWIVAGTPFTASLLFQLSISSKLADSGLTTRDITNMSNGEEIDFTNSWFILFFLTSLLFSSLYLLVAWLVIPYIMKNYDNKNDDLLEKLRGHTYFPIRVIVLFFICYFINILDHFNFMKRATDWWN